MANLNSPQLATLGGGCFWCTEAIYAGIPGVLKVVSGYAGGRVDNPTYRQVCGGDTGHAEVIQVTFDPARVSYETLLDVFFHTHDPTTLNRQGNDVGTQYRSAIFFHDPEQQRIAEEAVRALNAAGEFPSPIVTQIVPYSNYFPAESYHQEYLARNAEQPYCQLVVSPKLEKFRKRYRDLLTGG